jgi:hypothetical protein
LNRHFGSQLGIEEGQQRYVPALRAKLAGHLERHEATRRTTAKEIRPFGLQRAHLADIAGRHVLDLRKVGPLSVLVLRLKTVEGLIRG